MKIYGAMGSESILKIPSVTTLPEWSYVYTYRMVYNKEDTLLYYGTATGWSKVIEHVHSNKSVLDDITDENGYLLYNGGMVGGLLNIKTEHVFSSTSTRDIYFYENPSELEEDLYVIVLPNYLYVYKDSAFISVTEIVRGPKGDTGFGVFTIRAAGPLSDKSLYNNEDQGFSFLAIDTQELYIRWGAYGVWGGPYEFPNLVSSGMDEWDRFPGYTLETKFDYPSEGVTTETLKLTLNSAVFATRVTSIVDDTTITIEVECPSMSIHRLNTLYDDGSTLTQTITNIED